MTGLSRRQIIQIADESGIKDHEAAVRLVRLALAAFNYNPPTDKEVTELVSLLRAEASDDDDHDHLLWMNATNARRAAELLQRRYQPAPALLSDNTMAEYKSLFGVGATCGGGLKLTKEQCAELVGLLEQRYPAPIEVAERPPGLKDCNMKGQCWQEEPGSATEPPGWYLEHYRSIIQYGRGKWLPFHSLPMTAGEGER